MKKVTPPKVLHLETSTVRALAREPLARVQGGAAPQSGAQQTCYCPPVHD